MLLIAEEASEGKDNVMIGREERWMSSVGRERRGQRRKDGGG